MWLLSKELAIPIQLQACACLISHRQGWQPCCSLGEDPGLSEQGFRGFCAGTGSSHPRGSVAVGWHRGACTELLHDVLVTSRSWGNGVLRTQNF